MKIFYFAGTKLPSQNPHSIHVMKMAQALGKMGNDVTLFAKSVNSAASEDLFKIYDSEPCFKLYLSAHFGVPLIAGATRLLDLSQKIARLDKPDLVYGHDCIALALFTPSDVPIIYEMHRIPLLSAHQLAFSRILKRQNLKAIVVVSDVLKAELLKRYPEILPETVFVAHDGADLIEHLTSTEDDTKNPLRGRPSALNVGYAGSLTPGKGMALISRLAKIRPQYDFHILGGTKKQIQKLETHSRLPNIYFYGHRDHSEVPQYLNAFDICVAPYQHRALIKTGNNTSRWISPMKIFEYMAVKKPIICSKLSIIEEILEHGHNAILVAASDDEKWAETIDMIKDNPEEAALLGGHAHESLADKYTWDKRAQAIMEFCASRKTSPLKFYKKAS